MNYSSAEQITEGFGKNISREKSEIVSLICTIAIAVFVPYMITTIMSGDYYRMSERLRNINSGKDVIVKKDGRNELIDVEFYILEVLAAECDMSWDDEILTARAVILRTEIYHKMGDCDVISSSEFEHQYYTYKDMKSKWGRKEFDRNVSRLESIIIKTEGKTE